MGTERLRAEDIILYEDKDILVCRKPGGFPVQTKRIGMMDMENMLKNYLAAKGRKALCGSCPSSGSAGPGNPGIWKESEKRSQAQ